MERYSFNPQGLQRFIVVSFTARKLVYTRVHCTCALCQLWRLVFCLLTKTQIGIAVIEIAQMQIDATHRLCGHLLCLPISNHSVRCACVSKTLVRAEQCFGRYSTRIPGITLPDREATDTAPHHTIRRCPPNGPGRAEGGRQNACPSVIHQPSDGRFGQIKNAP